MEFLLIAGLFAFPFFFIPTWISIKNIDVNALTVLLINVLIVVSAFFWVNLSFQTIPGVKRHAHSMMVLAFAIIPIHLIMWIFLMRYAASTKDISKKL